MTSLIRRIIINSMLETEIKENFARNVRELRIDRKLNQIQLGEKLSYSSKAVSKWENGDVMPDITTLKLIADFFDITVDTLISSKNAVRKSHKRRNRILITAVSSLLCYFVAAIVFLILTLVYVDKAWVSFIVAIPASGVVCVVFSSLWFERKYITLSTIFLTLGACLVTWIFMNFYLWWIVSLSGAIFIVLAIIFFPIIIPNNRK